MSSKKIKQSNDLNPGSFKHLLNKTLDENEKFIL